MYIEEMYFGEYIYNYNNVEEMYFGEYIHMCDRHSVAFILHFKW